MASCLGMGRDCDSVRNKLEPKQSICYTSSGFRIFYIPRVDKYLVEHTVR